MDAATLPQGISTIRLGSSGSLPGLRVKTAHCEAVIALQGAQILSFQATGKENLLWLSEKAVFAPGKAIRGGIPLCFPWFGPHPQDASKPAHGFARNREWQLREIIQQEGICTLHFRLEDDEQTRALWPHAFKADLAIALGHTLALTLTVQNRDDQPWPLSFAFHSYFPVSAIRQVQVEGLENTGFIDQRSAERSQHRQSGALTFNGETDRIYLQAKGNYRLRDTRNTGIAASNCHSAIVWNPWQEKTSRLHDMQPDAWQQMLCVECGNVESDALRLAPGEMQTFALELQGD